MVREGWGNRILKWSIMMYVPNAETPVEPRQTMRNHRTRSHIESAHHPTKKLGNVSLKDAIHGGWHEFTDCSWETRNDSATRKRADRTGG